MPEVQIIMGESGVGKSRTTRALTGAFNSGSLKIKNNDGEVMDILVQIRALQEVKIDPKTFIREHERDKYILLNLWVNSGNGEPDGLEYIERFRREHGWSIKDIIVLGRDFSDLPFSLPQDISTYSIPDSKNKSANEIAHEIRERWEWL